MQDMTEKKEDAASGDKNSQKSQGAYLTGKRKNKRDYDQKR